MIAAEAGTGDTLIIKRKRAERCFAHVCFAASASRFAFMRFPSDSIRTTVSDSPSLHETIRPLQRQSATATRQPDGADQAQGG